MLLCDLRNEWKVLTMMSLDFNSNGSDSRPSPLRLLLLTNVPFELLTTLTQIWMARLTSCTRVRMQALGIPDFCYIPLLASWRVKHGVPRARYRVPQEVRPVPELANMVSWAGGEDKRKKLNTADAGDRARRFVPSRGFAAVCAAVLPLTLSIILGI